MCRTLFEKFDYEQVGPKKKWHGRLEQRTYRCYSVGASVLAPRRHPTGLATLIGVERCRQQADVLSQQTHYFVSNAGVISQADADELFGAIGQHW